MSILKTKKILEDVHPLDVINEVKKWPVLYRRDNPERLNFHFKTKIWHEVAKNLITGWEQLSDSEKEIKVSDLNKKWRNLRDTFRRQVEVERKVREGAPAGKRRYVYFKHMLFLLPHVAPAAPAAPAPDPRLDRYLAATAAAERRPPRAPRPPRRAARRRPDTPPASAADSDTTACAADIDEDRHFLMSLVPSFKKMSDDEKLTAKVEILKVIQQIRNASAELASPEVAYVQEAARGDGDGAVKVELSPEGDDCSDDSDDAADGCL